jgi:hypothetical protein
MIPWILGDLTSIHRARMIRVTEGTPPRVETGGGQARRR